jgi:hypothetical protein
MSLSADSQLLLPYDLQVQKELKLWQRQMQKRPSLFNALSSTIQKRINRAIPENIHLVMTTAIKQMTRAIIFGSDITTRKPLVDISLEERERLILNNIKIYRNTATAEGAVTGAGGILLGLADFPIWLTIKMKMLFDIAAKYGFDTRIIKNEFTFFTFLN